MDGWLSLGKMTGGLLVWALFLLSCRPFCYQIRSSVEPYSHVWLFPGKMSVKHKCDAIGWTVHAKALVNWLFFSYPAVVEHSNLYLRPVFVDDRTNELPVVSGDVAVRFPFFHPGMIWQKIPGLMWSLAAVDHRTASKHCVEAPMNHVVVPTPRPDLWLRFMMIYAWDHISINHPVVQTLRSIR